MNRTFKAAVATLMLAVSFAGSVAAGPLEDAKAILAASAANGRGDYATALRLLRPLAEQGNADAQTMLGETYYNGRGVPKDYAIAASWWTRAAQQGNVGAQVLLGALYYFGHGVPQDYVLAHMWYNLAAAAGGEKLDFVIAATGAGMKAAEFRDGVAKLMTPAQVAEAQKLAREWKPK
jgi:uncharacterized protein